ncbi:MAG: hypothetical protein VYE64_03115 [Planctomycetota bacterium]|nr:hypothetical protein [Planctomycetota bacterium]
MFDESAQLLERGIYVPLCNPNLELEYIKSPNHVELNVFSLAEGRFSVAKTNFNKSNAISWEGFRQGLVNDISLIYNDAKKQDCNTVLFSNEGLYLLNSEEEYLVLQGLFLKHTDSIKVLCCFRDVEDFQKSYKRQLFKMGFSASSKPDSFRYLEPDSWLFDYERKKRLVSSVFPDAVYWSYDSKDNVKAFLKLIGASDLQLKTRRLNQSRLGQIFIGRCKKVISWAVRKLKR